MGRGFGEDAPKSTAHSASVIINLESMASKQPERSYDQSLWGEQSGQLD